MYDIILTKTARKQLGKLPKEAQERVLAALERARIRPEQHFERLVGETTYKLRVGDYRIIADILQDKLIILVLEVDHRRRIYKGRLC